MAKRSLISGRWVVLRETSSGGIIVAALAIGSDYAAAKSVACLLGAGHYASFAVGRV